MLQAYSRTEQAVSALATALDVEATPGAVLRSAFDWYYVPLAADRQAYRERVLANVMETIVIDSSDSFPDWFWRVHAILVEGAKLSEGSVPPPPDPR